MKNYLVFLFSALLVILGFILEDRGFAIMKADDGTFIYPISSGSEAGLILKIGLVCFLLSLITSVLVIFIKKDSRAAIISYLIISVLFCFFIFLVSLNSSFILAASLGDWLPLFAVSIWLLSIISLVLSFLINAIKHKS